MQLKNISLIVPINAKVLIKSRHLECFYTKKNILSTANLDFSLSKQLNQKILHILVKLQFYFILSAVLV